VLWWSKSNGGTLCFGALDPLALLSSPLKFDSQYGEEPSTVNLPAKFKSHVVHMFDYFSSSG